MTPRSNGQARPHHPPRGRKKRSGSNVPPPTQSRRGINPQKKWGKKRKKKRGGLLHLPPLMAVLSVLIQVQTQLIPMTLPHLFLEMSDLKPFPKMTLTMNICAHIAGLSIRLVVMIYKIHRFLFSFANIDFAEIASIVWRGRIVP